MRRLTASGAVLSNDAGEKVMDIRGWASAAGAVRTSKAAQAVAT